jgi:hypothetical protein
MNAQPQAETGNLKLETRRSPRLAARTLRALHAEWRKLSPNLEIEPLEGETPKDAERRVRIEWSNRQIVRSRDRQIESWSQLTTGQAKFLLKRMKEESGSGPAFRAQFIAELAIRLWGSDWDAFLGERLRERFRVSRAQDLAPRDARAMIEEFKSRIERGKEEPVAQTSAIEVCGTLEKPRT